MIIWLVYAQLLYLGFRRQRRPRLIINRGKNKDINGLCIISNMSAESVYIQYIIADLTTSRGTITQDVTDFEQFNDDEGKQDNDDQASLAFGPVEDNTRQGPMASGSCRHIGSYADLIIRLARDEGVEMVGYRPKDESLEFHSLTIRLIAIYGPEDQPIGAERTFKLEDRSGHCNLVPASWDTRRLASKWQRRKLAKQVKRLNDTNFISSSQLKE
nr:hypothetical protein [Halomonas populi]